LWDVRVMIQTSKFASLPQNILKIPSFSSSRACRTKTKGLKPCRARITTTQKANGLYRINITQPVHNHEQTNRIIKKLNAKDA
jgi:hypothetical protein